MSVNNMNIETFNQMVIKERKPALIEFWAPWCTYCRRIGPAFDQIAGQYGEKLLIAKVNIDDAPELEEKYHIEFVPTFLLFDEGEPKERLIAPDSKAQIEEFMKDYLGEQKTQIKHVHDVLILGGGPGGYTAALYCSRAGMDTVVLEKLSAGGQMGQTTQIDNYPGFEEGIDGFTLGEKMRLGAERFGTKTVITKVEEVDLFGEEKVAKTSEGTFYGRSVIIATGAEHRHLGVAQEEELVGHGVNYCAACDGMFYKGKTVVVVGGGNSAAADAMLLSRICEKVILVHRRDTLRATKVYHDPLMKAENIEFCWNAAVSELLYEEKITGVKVKDVNTGEERILPCEGVFISIGRSPATELFKDKLELDKAGYIKADETTKTSIPGVFAVGDVRTKPMRQVVTAVGDGAVASHYVEEYLSL